MRSMTEDDIKVNIYLPSDLSKVKQIWTNTYCNFALNLLNSSELKTEDKHKMIDNITAYFSSNPNGNLASDLEANLIK